jgi:hypothetical protein
MGVHLYLSYSTGAHVDLVGRGAGHQYLPCLSAPRTVAELLSLQRRVFDRMYVNWFHVPLLQV